MAPMPSQWLQRVPSPSENVGYTASGDPWEAARTSGEARGTSSVKGFVKRMSKHAGHPGSHGFESIIRTWCRAHSASVGRIGYPLAGYGVSWQDRASVDRIGRQLAGQGVSWQDRASVGRIGYQLAG